MRKLFLALAFVILWQTSIFAQTEKIEGKNPIIVIPGVMGSTLINSETKETAWVKFSESKNDDLALPISTNFTTNRDKLVVGDIVEEVKIVKFLPGMSVYGDLLKYLDKKAGYQRIIWEKAQPTDDKDTYFVFAYDWRRDNVENAKLLIQKIEKLKLKLGKPNLKFDILAHSMGGIIARYAAMYGTQDLQAKPNPNWYGTRHFNKIIMLGTPNEGSMGALDTFYNGYSIATPAGRFYPSFLSREVGFTIPTLYQLLPHGKAIKFYDEDLNPTDIDIYQIDNWEKYGWSYLEDEKLTKNMTKAKRQQASKFLEAVLTRTKKFHEALDVKTVIPESIKFFAYGSDCKNTLDAAIIYFDKEKENWKTLMRGDSFRNSKGEKIAEKKVEETIFAIGDGVVSSRSFLAETISQINGQTLFLWNLIKPNKKLVCEAHVSIPNNKAVQEEFYSILTSK